MIIGIGGVSRSGKTQFANLVFSSVANSEKAILRLDDYLLPENQLSTIDGHIDWEVPSAYDFVRYKSDIREFSNRFEILIIEGFLIYNDPEIVQLCDVKFFIEISKSTFLERKNKDKRWGVEPLWYQHYIWSCYLKFGKPDNLDEFFRLSGEIPFDIDILNSAIN